jgi:hypothetical protein
MEAYRGSRSKLHLTSTLMEVSIEQEAGWHADPFWTFWRREKSDGATDVTTRVAIGTKLIL